MENRHNIFSGISEEGREIFSLLQKKGPFTKNDLLNFTGTNLSTLNRMIQPLETKRLVVEAGIGESSGGRKPVLYDVDQNNFFVAGIEISRPYTQVTITNLKAKIITKQQFAMDATFVPQKTVNLVAKIFQDLINRSGIDYQKIAGVGLGTVGPLDRDRGVMISPRNFEAPGWSNVPIKSMLEEKLNIPVIIDNGANTAVLAEQYFGEGKNFQNIAYFNCSIGIRTGAASGGNLIRTINDIEDAFGHMVIDLIDGEPCHCGNYGCIECYSSIFSIVQKFISALKKGRSSVITKPLEQINYLDICEAADANDELARETIINAATIFGAGLANYINLLNPNLIILNGPLVSHSDLFYHICKDVALRKHYLKENCRIYFSKGGFFKDDAISTGAAAMVIEKYLTEK